MLKYPCPLASSEDGVDWYERSRTGRLGARVATAHMVAEPLWLLDVLRHGVTPKHMRPVVCPLPGHVDGNRGGVLDSHGFLDPPDDCRCDYVDEAWHECCDADDPAAIPVWEVEWVRELPRPLTRLRWRLTRRRWRYRPVLWGVRVRGGRGLVDQLRIGENRIERSKPRLRGVA